MRIFGKNILNNFKVISDVELDEVLLNNYYINDARAALFSNTTVGSLVTNGVVQYDTGYHITNDLIPYVTSGVIKNMSNRTIIGTIYATCVCFTNPPNHVIDVEAVVNDASYSFGRIRFFQRTGNAQTSGSIVAGSAALLPGQELKLRVNTGYFDGFSEARLSFIEFRNTRGGLNDLVIV